MTDARPTDVAIVITNLNAGRYLEGALAAIPAATARRSLDVVVVDNGSTDGSPAMVTTRFPWVRLIQNPEDFGFGKANNVGARTSTGPFVLLLSSDCDLAPGALDVMADELDQAPGIAGVFPRLLNADGSLQPSIHESFPSPWAVAGELLFLPQLRYRIYRTPAWHRWLLRRTIRRHATSREIAWGGGACMLLRRQAWERVQGFDEGFFLYWEDVDLCKRLGDAGFRPRYVAPACAVHHWAKATSQMPLATIMRVSYRSRVRYFDKHFPGAGGAIVRALTQAELRMRSRVFSLLARLQSSRRHDLRERAAANAACARMMRDA